MMSNQIILAFLQKEWKFIVILVVILGILGIGYYEYKQHETLPMTTIQNISIPDISKALSDLKLTDQTVSAKEVVEKIVEAKQSPPQQVFVTTTQAVADKKANVIAKTDKADAVIKQTEPIKPNEPIVNNYYGIHTEKNHKIKAGVSVIDSQAYVDLGYQQEKNELIAHYAPATGKYGVTYMRTLIEW